MWGVLVLVVSGWKSRGQFSSVRLQKQTDFSVSRVVAIFADLEVYLHGLLRYNPNLFYLKSSQGLYKPGHPPSLFKES